MQLFSSSIGRKVVMSISGASMILFAIIHLVGNSTIFGWLPGGINAYAHHLHSLPAPIIIGFRIGLLVFFAAHVWYGIQLTLENRGGRPQQYAVKSTQKAGFASENMIWSGLFILAFVLYHLAHFTFQCISPETAALKHLVDGVPDVLGMVAAGFKSFFVTIIYAGAMVAVFLHLSHGVQSLFQTLGLSNDRTLCTITKAGTLVALALFLGYVAVPFSIFAGILK